MREIKTCGARAHRALAASPGVRQAQVEVSRQTAVVTVSANSCDPNALLNALSDVGFGGYVIRER
jgi:hypothetical protein